MRNTLDAFKKGERQQIGHVLLTGATGYLGIHVLKELIEREDVPVIWCIVRAQNTDKAERRLKGLLFYYYANNYKELFGKRLRIVLGDVTQPIKVDGHVDTVFNCAAIVKHFSNGTEIEDVNIGGAVNCIRFCLETGARLIHISTYSTAGLSVNGVPAPDTIQTEQKLYYGQYMDNRYVHSKFVAERTILEAVAVHQLNAKVMRVGNLSPRSTDGEFQINFQTNSAMGRVRLYKVLGCYLLLLVFIVRKTIKYINHLTIADQQQQMIDQEMRIAHNIQMNILRQDFPEELSAKLIPMKEVGGDLYDFYQQGDTLYFIIGDVSGKGIPAAMMMAATVNLFRMAARHFNTPADIMSEINHVLSERNPIMMFVTAFVGKIDMRHGLLTY